MLRHADAPVVVVVVLRAGHAYTPAGDIGAIDLRVRDIWSSHTPLVGPYGNHGWDHPGPLLFYLLAVPSLLAGHGAWGTQVGGALLQGVAIVWLAVLAWRRGGLALLATAMVGISLLANSMSPEQVRDPWNPHVALPFFARFVFQAWLLATGEAKQLPWAVVVASFVVQTHVGYLPLVVAAAVVVVVCCAVDRRHPRGDVPPAVTAGAWRRAVGWSLLAAFVLWLPPVIDALTDWPGNLGDIAGYFLHPDRAVHPQIGLSAGARLFAAEFAPFPDWLRGSSGVGFAGLPLGQIGGVVPDPGAAPRGRHRGRPSPPRGRDGAIPRARRRPRRRGLPRAGARGRATAVVPALLAPGHPDRPRARLGMGVARRDRADEAMRARRGADRRGAAPRLGLGAVRDRCCARVGPRLGHRTGDGVAGSATPAARRADAWCDPAPRRDVDVAVAAWSARRTAASSRRRVRRPESVVPVPRRARSHPAVGGPRVVGRGGEGGAELTELMARPGARLVASWSPLDRQSERRARHLSSRLRTRFHALQRPDLDAALDGPFLALLTEDVEGVDHDAARTLTALNVRAGRVGPRTGVVSFAPGDAPARVGDAGS